MKFSESNLREDIKKTIIEGFGFEDQTLIQEKSIPLILDGKDILGESATGSGKTLAFGVGIVEKVIPKKGLQGLIITPTRELAEQVKKYIVKLAPKLHVISIYGGVSINPQIDGLRKAEVVIATPGRFKDHLQRGTVDTDNVNIVVLDEADRMLDMGFVEDIRDIMGVCPKNRQTLFFSATMPTEIQKLANQYLKDPVKVSATKQVNPAKLTQVYYDVKKNEKFSLLIHLLNEEKSKLVMIFCNTRKSTDTVVKNLILNKIQATALHGGYTQNKREKSLEMLKKGKLNVLVCTDVAARGIHIEEVSHIYNYEIPKDPTDYVHRIGRTARAGKDGKVINLLCDYDYDNFSRLLNEYREFNVEKMNNPEIKKAIYKTKSNTGRSFGPRSSNRSESRSGNSFGNKSRGNSRYKKRSY